MAVFVHDARRRGQSGARSVSGTLLVNAVDFGSFLLVLLGGLIILYLRHNLTTYELITGIIMFVYVGGIAPLLGLGLWRPTT